MNTYERLPEGVRVTMETFERLIAADEGRRRELTGEISVLVKRHNELAAGQDASWILESFVEPRLKELNGVVRRLQLIRGRLTQLQDNWGLRPVSLACYEPNVEDAAILCVTA